MPDTEEERIDREVALLALALGGAMMRITDKMFLDLAAIRDDGKEAMSEVSD